MREPTTTLPAKPADRWMRRIVGWIYVAIGAAICSGVIADVGPFAPLPESPEDRRMEWASITMPVVLFAGLFFAFVGYWAMTRPRVHRTSTIGIVFVLLVISMVAYREL